jgi:hypothetical protein
MKLIKRIKRFIKRRRIRIESNDLERSPLTPQIDTNYPQPSTSSSITYYGTIGPYFEALRKRLFWLSDSNQVMWHWHWIPP